MEEMERRLKELEKKVEGVEELEKKVAKMEKSLVVLMCQTVYGGVAEAFEDEDITEDDLTEMLGLLDELNSSIENDEEFEFSIDKIDVTEYEGNGKIVPIERLMEIRDNLKKEFGKEEE